ATPCRTPRSGITARASSSRTCASTSTTTTRSWCTFWSSSTPAPPRRRRTCWRPPPAARWRSRRWRRSRVRLIRRLCWSGGAWRQWLLWLVVGRQELELPPADVAPGGCLEADVAVDADLLEAERLVEADAGVVRQGDAGAGDVEALLAQERTEMLVELAADAAAVVCGVDVDGHVDGPAVCRALAVGRGVRVADDLPAVLRDEPRMRRGGASHSLRHLGGAGRRLLEGGRTFHHVRRVDRGACRRVPLDLGSADHAR